MKKILLIALLSIFSFGAYAQQGEMSVGLGGGYTSDYENALFGVNINYNLTDHLQLSLSEMLNPSLKYDVLGLDRKIGMYETSLDARLFLIHMKDWGTGPNIGGQYLIIRDKDNSLRDYDGAGFSIGWHAMANLGDNFRLSGGWKWTSYSEGKDSNHFFYVGLSYAFDLF